MKETCRCKFYLQLFIQQICLVPNNGLCAESYWFLTEPVTTTTTTTIAITLISIISHKLIELHSEFTGLPYIY